MKIFLWLYICWQWIWVSLVGLRQETLPTNACGSMEQWDPHVSEEISPMIKLVMIISRHAHYDANYLTTYAIVCHRPVEQWSAVAGLPCYFLVYFSFHINYEYIMPFYFISLSGYHDEYIHESNIHKYVIKLVIVNSITTCLLCMPDGRLACIPTPIKRCHATELLKLLHPLIV